MAGYVGNIPLDGKLLCYGATAVSRLYAGTHLIYDEGGPGPGPSTLVGVTMGDSTIAAYMGGAEVSSLIDGYVATSLANPGDSINQQLSLWNALGDYSGLEVVIAQIGLNDITGSGTAVAAIGRLQNLVNTVRGTAPSGCKIYVSKMLPCKARFTTLFGANAPVAQQQWVDLNDAIAGEGPTPITGVDGRVVSHVPLLDDGNGNLHPDYDLGDGIHENTAGRQIIADAWRAKWVADGLLT